MTGEPVFVVGDKLVHAKYKEKSEVFGVCTKIGPGDTAGTSWHVDPETFVEEYTPVSEMAEYEIDRAGHAGVLDQ